jgi:hypothetical protein
MGVVSSIEFFWSNVTNPAIPTIAPRKIARVHFFPMIAPRTDETSASDGKW